MARPAARMGDIDMGHGCFPPTMAIRGSMNVNINGRGAMYVGGMYSPHCCPKAGCHSPIQTMGSSKVSINGIPAARLGDATSCGGVTISGSSNVFIGG